MSKSRSSDDQPQGDPDYEQEGLPPQDPEQKTYTGPDESTPEQLPEVEASPEGSGGTVTDEGGRPLTDEGGRILRKDGRQDTEIEEQTSDTVSGQKQPEQT